MARYVDIEMVVGNREPRVVNRLIAVHSIHKNTILNAASGHYDKYMHLLNEWTKTFNNGEKENYKVKPEYEQIRNDAVLVRGTKVPVVFRFTESYEKKI